MTPFKETAEAQTALLYIALFYIVQPLVFVGMLLGSKPWPLRLAATAWYVTTFSLLAGKFKRAVGEENWHTNMMLLWWPYALLVTKYINALVDPNFRSTFRLSTFTRVALFCYFSPTILFRNNDKEHNNNSHRGGQSRRTPSRMIKAMVLLTRGVTQIGINNLIARAVLQYDNSSLPWWICNLLLFYQVALSQGGAADILFNAPTALFISPEDADIVYVADVPALSVHPRLLWQRWSKSASYHFRHAIYEPLGGYHSRSPWLATLCTFAVNCALHIFWWGPVTVQRWVWEYIWLLLIGPMFALSIDKYVLQLAFPKGTALYTISNWILLQVLVALLTQSLLTANGLPLTLKDMALLNTGH